MVRFKRDKYLRKLISLRKNGLVKVITGIRRCGKSYLLNVLFREYLLNEEGISPSRIVSFAFDDEENISLLDAYSKESPTIVKEGRTSLVSARKFLAYVNELTKEEGEYVLILDEVQNLENFVRVLNSFIRKGNIDVYVTGSNSRFLSSEVDTEFGGRADTIHLLPISFSEYLEGSSLEPRAALDEYLRYGGIPMVQNRDGDEEKASEATSIYKETYLRDIQSRHPNASIVDVESTLRVIASSISSPINPQRIANTFSAVLRKKASYDSIDEYLRWFQEAFLVDRSLRFDVKGRRYIGTPFKCYFEDLGIRNAVLSFRELDPTDLIENLVYNELRYRGYSVDVGVVRIKERTDRIDRNGKPIYVDKDLEVDFVASLGARKVYVQVATEIATPEKKEREYRPLRNVPDSFRKVLIVLNEGKGFYTDEGFYRMGLLDFLLDATSLER